MFLTCPQVLLGLCSVLDPVGTHPVCPMEWVQWSCPQTGQAHPSTWGAPEGASKIWRKSIDLVCLLTTGDMEGCKIEREKFSKHTNLVVLKHDLCPNRKTFFFSTWKEKSFFLKKWGQWPSGIRAMLCVLCGSAVSGHQFTLPLKYFRIQLSLLVFILQGLWLQLEH